MTISHEFEYFKPESLAEALELKEKYGARASLLAGGTDLINNLDDEVVSPEAVIDLKGIKELARLDTSGSRLVIGALATFSDLLESPVVKKGYPLLWEAAGEVASVSIRNRATMVGNLCSCVPCLDSGPPLVIYEALVILNGTKGKRTIPIFDFVQGPRRTTLRDDEIAVGVVIPELPAKRGEGFVKLKRYKGEDLAQASVGVMAVAGGEFRVAFGSVAPVPVRARSIEKLLKGKKLSPGLIAEAQKLVANEIAPISDVRAGKEYRLHMCRVMLERALNASASRLQGDGPKYGTSLI